MMEIIIVVMILVLVPVTPIVIQDITVINPHVMILLVIVSNALMIMDVWPKKFVVVMVKPMTMRWKQPMLMSL